MPHPILASFAIQAGFTMIKEGLERLLPEIAIALDEPGIESLSKYIKPEKAAKQVLAVIATPRLQS